MDIGDEEILSIWRSLHENNVKYILVGGFAVGFNGYSRFTADLDIWIKDDKENRRNLRKSFEESGLGDMEELETAQFIPGWSSIVLSSGFEIDLMSSLKGFSSEMFDECYALAPTAVMRDVPVKFLHINQLIKEKKALGLPKDLLDIEELEKIRDGK